MTILKRLLVSYLKTSVSEDYDQEKNRKIVVVNLFGLVGFFITFSMGVTALFNQTYALAVVLFLAGALFSGGHYYQRATHNTRVSSYIILYCLFALMVYLVHDGGVNNTGPLWIFMVAPVTLFFMGLKYGLMNLGMFVLAICVVMFFPNDSLLNAAYTHEFKLRLLYSFLTVTFLSSFYEYSRQQSFEFMQELSQKYERLAKLDPLTQLSNRRDAMSKLEYEQRRIERNQSSIGVLLCDVDNFKRINDQYGHDIGDKVLVELAKVFSSGIRKQDTVARWGGEEFIFILPQTSSQQAFIVAEKIRKRLYEQLLVDEMDHPVTISIGIGEINLSTTVHDAVNEADKYLYVAKNAGRNCVMPNDNASRLENLNQPAMAANHKL